MKSTIFNRRKNSESYDVRTLRAVRRQVNERLQVKLSVHGERIIEEGKVFV
jgi:hypothetical protein